MYTTISYIISKYTNLPFPEFVQSRIFDKLGMRHTTYSREVAEASGLFSQSWMANGRRIPFRSADQIVSAGPGGIISSAADLVRAFYWWPRTLVWSFDGLLMYRGNGFSLSWTKALFLVQIQRYCPRSRTGPLQRRRQWSLVKALAECRS